jgi:pyruvate/2-oxoglutarate/acetoin dehydrogenase E1 component
LKTTLAGALRETLKEMMQSDDRIFIMGEDVGEYGGIYNVTRGLLNQFGEKRVFNTPLSELAICGSGIGAAVAGLRPVIEIMYADFLTMVMDQIINNAAKMSYLSCGKIKVPLVIRSNFGCGKGEGTHHSQSPEAWFMNVAGLKIVEPSTPADARGLLISSINDDNPVIFLEHKLLYGLSGEIGEIDNAAIPLGKADIKRKGTDLTIVSAAAMVHKALSAAEELKVEENINVEVIDLRTIKPFDIEMISDSIRKTGRLLTVEEAPYTAGWGAQIVDSMVRAEFDQFKVRPQRLTGLDIPIPVKKELEAMVIPSVNAIKEKVKEMMK